MYFSRYNIIVPYEDKYAIINPLSGSFDVADADEIDRLKNPENLTDDFDLLDYGISRGYVYESKEDEEIRIEEAYKEFTDIMETSQTQILLIPTYGCNFSCIYCYERGIPGRHDVITRETVDAFFYDVEERLKDEKVKPYITLFGGEPFINTEHQKEAISYIVDKAAEKGYEIAAVTNGYDLTDYLDIIKRANIKEIQVTLDGPPEVHNKRRRLIGGKDSFVRIIEGMHALVEADIPVNLRVVADMDNYDSLPELAEILDGEGFLDLPEEAFKTQIGRNYELFECSLNHNSLITQAEQWAYFEKLSEDYPILRKFHKPDFKGIRNAVLTGSMYSPTFDTCPAGKKEWVYDLYGDIYGCTASCGRKDYRLGKYYPEREIYEDKLKPWRERNVLNIKDCVDCPVSLVCGGGCGVLANERNGSVLSPDCHDIGSVFESGIKYYSEDIKEALQ